NRPLERSLHAINITIILIIDLRGIAAKRRLSITNDAGGRTPKAHSGKILRPNTRNTLYQAFAARHIIAPTHWGPAMKSPHVVLLFLALTVTISSFAQGRPGSGSGKTPAPTVRSMPSTSQPQLNAPNLGRFFLSGKVVLDQAFAARHIIAPTHWGPAMKSPHVVLLFLALTVTISSFAQGRPGSGSGKTPAPTVRSMPSTSQPQLNAPNLGRFFLSGKVV